MIEWWLLWNNRADTEESVQPRAPGTINIHQRAPVVRLYRVAVAALVRLCTPVYASNERNSQRGISLFELEHADVFRKSAAKR